jgi:endogenous inhibitor of DNA gyrase (YacG/DUF329 family)
MMGCRGESREFTFVCPACEESMEVNGSMRDALIERGCVICGAPVVADAFSGASSTHEP